MGLHIRSTGQAGGSSSGSAGKYPGPALSTISKSSQVAALVASGVSSNAAQQAISSNVQAQAPPDAVFAANQDMYSDKCGSCWAQVASRGVSEVHWIEWFSEGDLQPSVQQVGSNQTSL